MKEVGKEGRHIGERKKRRNPGRKRNKEMANRREAGRGKNGGRNGGR